MKKIFLLSTLLILSLLAVSQVSEGESVLVYALPKTELCIHVTTEKITQKPGMFYRYSERYLATNKVITEEKTSCRIKNITVTTHAIPDPNRTYSFVPDNKLQTSKLTVNSQGILCGVNVACEQDVELPKITELPAKDNFIHDDLLPLGEEYMMAGSEAKLAEGAAKQIYHIRESRLNILTAESDKLPADGDSFKAMLEGLKNAESRLTELFIGKTITETETKTLYITPKTKIENNVLFRLSVLKGIVSTDDLSGVPYYINIIPTETDAVSPESKSKPDKGVLFYVLPKSTQISVTDGINTLYDNLFYLPQFGKTLSLPESLFKQSQVKVLIDQQTGRLLSIE